MSRPPTHEAKQKAKVGGKPLPKPSFEHLADDYVKEGMQRFVDRLYSRGLPYGGMLAYVIDGQVDAAFDRVCEEIAARRASLKMKIRSPLTTPSIALPAWKHSADTVHHRSDREFKLYHLLVGVK